MIRKRRNDVIIKEDKIINLISEMKSSGEKITYYSVAKKAGCTRNFLYNSLRISSLIKQERELSYKLNTFGTDDKIVVGLNKNIPNEILKKFLVTLAQTKFIKRYILDDKDKVDVVFLKNNNKTICEIKTQINVIDNKAYFLVVFPDKTSAVYDNVNTLVEMVEKKLD